MTEQYTYDANGNRLTGLDGGVTSTGTYDDQDRLITYGDWTYSYTANGELATKTNSTTNEEWTYDYDVMGNLRSVTLPDDRVVSYVHDGRNRRIAKLIDGIAVRRWVYGDQLNPVLELDGSGAPLFRYVYASMAHSPDYIIDANGVSYRVLRDQLGSPLLIVNTTNSADVMLNARYSAFGRRTVTAGTHESALPTLGFAGGIYDEDTGLTRFGARDYDAVVGRWTAKDPILWNGGQAALYVYLDNEPVNAIDPSGQSKFDKMFGLPKRFWNWYHRQVKGDGDADLTKDEALELLEEWKRLGKPGPDGKGPQWTDLAEDVLDMFPLPPVLTCVIFDTCNGNPGWFASDPC